MTVTVPEEIKSVAVNDQELKSGLLRSNQAYALDASVNAISVRYNEFSQHTDNSHDILMSGVVALKTPSLKDGETYRLFLIQVPEDFEAAQKYKVSQLLVPSMMQKISCWFSRRVLKMQRNHGLEIVC